MEQGAFKRKPFRIPRCVESFKVGVAVESGAVV